MKKSKLKSKFLVIPLALVLVLALSVAGYSALTQSASENNPKVILNGKTADFEVSGAGKAQNGNNDLFVGMKELMPGDSVKNTVTVGVKNFSDLKVKDITIFAKAVDNSEKGDYSTIVNAKDVEFSVTKDGKEIFTKLGEPVSLGTFTANGSTELDVTIKIKETAGNELQDLFGSIDWQFYIQSGPQLNTNDHFAYIIGYPDGTIRPERQITRAEVATIYFRLLTDDSRARYKKTTNSFSDVSTKDWFNNAVSTLSNAGILNGYPDGTFKPNEPITRAEKATIAAKFDIFTSEDVTVNKNFSDIKGHWAEDYILLAASRGWVNGYEDGTFKPDQNITRAESMKMVNYVLGRVVDKDGLAPIKGSKYYNEWSDVSLISGRDNADAKPWYYFHVQEATNSHDYYRTNRKVSDLPDKNYEEWFEVQAAPDWAALEKTW